MSLHCGEGAVSYPPSSQLNLENADQKRQQRNRAPTLVVCGDGHIHVLQWGVGVAQGDHRDAGIRGLMCTSESRNVR